MNQERIYQLSRYGNLLVVNAAVGGKDDLVRKVKLLLDTGSSYTVLRSNILENIGCDLEKPSQIIRTLTPGGMVTAPRIITPWFSCLGQRVDDFPIVAYTLPATTFVDGLVGMDFLSRFDLIISLKEGLIRYRQ